MINYCTNMLTRDSTVKQDADLFYDSSSGDDLKFRGISHYHDTLKLIRESTVPIAIPLTQEDGAMTTDMVEQRLAHLEAMEDSAERAAFQSR